MFSKKVFETDFRTALEEELGRRNMTIKELADRAGIPAATLYKLTSGEGDVRLSTVKKIVRVLEPRLRSSSRSSPPSSSSTRSKGRRS